MALTLAGETIRESGGGLLIMVNHHAICQGPFVPKGHFLQLVSRLRVQNAYKIELGLISISEACRALGFNTIPRVSLLTLSGGDGKVARWLQRR